MCFPIVDDILYIFFFANDQVIVDGDRDDASYILWKLQNEAEKWGLVTNKNETEYMVVGDSNQDEQNRGEKIIKK